jgi:hypothetical protein
VLRFKNYFYIRLGNFVPKKGEEGNWWGVDFWPGTYGQQRCCHPVQRKCQFELIGKMSFCNALYRIWCA